MLITPLFIRQCLADQTGRKPHGIMVRVWATAIFYGAIGFALGVGAGIGAGMLL